MSYQDYKYVSSLETASLTTAYLYTADELAYLKSGSVINFPFGTTEKDLFELSVYDMSGKQITSSLIHDGTLVNSITRSYVDVTNKVVVYSYEEHDTEYVIVGQPTQSVLFDTQGSLNDLSINEGFYKIGITPVREVVGSSADSKLRLIIDEISPSRKEIAVIPHSPRNTSVVSEIKLNDEFELFAHSKVKPSSITSVLLDSLEKVELYKTYLAVATKNPVTDSSIKYNYSFRTGVDVTHFITDMYYGVQKGSIKSNGTVSTRLVFGLFDQFKNFLYENYVATTTFAEITNYYYSLFAYILNQELNQITNSRPSNYDGVVDFFKQIFFDTIYLPKSDFTQFQYEKYFSGYLKNSINFGGGSVFPILNTGIIPSDNDYLHDRLILKLRDALPNKYKVGDNFWITNTTVSNTILQSVHFFTDSPVVTIPVKGPNFGIKLENEGNSTIDHSLETVIGESGSLYDELYSKLRYKLEDKSPINVDYRYFENFIKFSSVSERLAVFGYKRDRVEEIRIEIADLDAKLILNPNDEYYSKQRDDLDVEWNSLESSMDGYENFLYNNPNWYSEHTQIYGGSLSSGSMYDMNNADSLQNNLPAAISEAPENYEYVRFVNLVGHYFDNLTLFITQFTEKNNSANSEIEGVSKDVVYNMLASLGWEPEIGRENLPLILASFSKNDFDVDSELYDKVGIMSEDDRNKFIWKRILNNLPHILKSKGTEAAINSLISCYGIPRNLIQIKEYGGIEYTTNLDQNSRYIIDETRYSPHFSGSSEFFTLPWTGSAQTLEFNFSFDTDKVNQQGQVFRLAHASGSWAIGILKERGTDWGKAFFTIQDTGSNTLTTVTNRAPFFNGDVYSLMLRHSGVDADFNLSSTASLSVSDNYPQNYELLIRRSEDSRTTFEATSSIYLSGSYNTSFRLPQNLYLGNYEQSTASLSIDPEAFFGTIDEIRVWESFLTTDRFNHHSTFKGSYDDTSPSSMVDKNLIRITFSTPIDLYDTSSNVIIGNSAFRELSSDISASNFPFYGVATLDSTECESYTSSSTYPYQFKKFETQQTMNLPNFGSNKFRSNKINYKQQILSSNLSSDTRSTIPSINDSPTDANKLGIFFSPTEQLNLEIIKFFGNFEFGDLIGKPSDVYEKNYSRFEKFRQVFYDRGFGNIDYQTFMNLVRAYFDKSLFKYIKNLVPARAKLVTGVLVEPSILERPKIQLRPIARENINIPEDGINYITKELQSSLIQQLTQSIDRYVNGTAVYEDAESAFFADKMEPYGFSILAKNGVSYYKDDYWRVEVVPVQKTYTVRRKNRPATAMTEALAYTTNRGEFQTITKTFERINISQFPIVTEYPGFILTSGQAVFDGTITTVSGITTIDGAFTTNGTTLVSSSGATGKIINNLGITMEGPSANISSDGISSCTILGAVTCSFYSLKENQSIFNALSGNTSGSLFSNIKDNEYVYRYALSTQNVPQGSYPLNGYFGSHYKYKRVNNDRKSIVTLDNRGNVSGTFKKGLQTVKTTVHSGSGLFDNTPPVVITEVV